MAGGKDIGSFVMHVSINMSGGVEKWGLPGSEAFLVMLVGRVKGKKGERRSQEVPLYRHLLLFSRNTGTGQKAGQCVIDVERLMEQ